MATHLKTWRTYFAISGTASPHYGGDIYGQIRVYLENQNYANNTSLIRIDHYYITDGDYAITGTATGLISKYRVNNGSYGGTYQQVSIDNTGALYKGTYFMGSTYHTVYHNPDGSARLYVNGSINGTWYPNVGSSEKSFTRTSSFNDVTLPTIPRYATINSYNLTTASMTSLNVSWSANVTCDQVQYSLNGGSWITAQTGDRTSGNFNITGLIPGVSYSVKIRVRRKDSQLYTESSAKNATTVDIAKITNANVNFDIDTGITLNFTNPSGSVVDLYLESPNGTVRVTRTGITNPYVLELTPEEKNILFGLAPTSNSLAVRFRLRTADTYDSNRDGIATISNANPIFSNFEYEDINPITLALTGNNQTIIKSYSTLKAIISTSNKAVAQKGATMDKYRLVVGEKQIDVPYSASETVELTLNAIDNNVFMVYAIDSRGNSTVVQKSPTNYFAYSKVIIANGTTERIGGIGDETTLTFNGSFLNIDFGSEQNNITIAYKYKKTSDEEYIDGTTTITPIINENNFSFEGLIAGDKGALGFDSQYSYNIKIIATDELSSASYDLILGTGKPNMAIHRKGVAINKIYDEVNNPIFDAGRFRVDENGDLQQYDETLEQYLPILEYEVVDTW